LTVGELRRLLERYPEGLEVVVPMEYGGELLARRFVRVETMLRSPSDVDLPPWQGPLTFTGDADDEAPDGGWARVLALGRIRE